MNNNHPEQTATAKIGPTKPCVFLRLPQVQAKIGLSRSVIYRLIQQRDFPAPIKLIKGGRTSTWIESEVQEWMNQQVADSRQTNTNQA